MKFLIDALRRKVIKAFETFGFKVVKVEITYQIVGENPDRTKTPLTMPNHERIKGSTLRVICREVGIKEKNSQKLMKEYELCLTFCGHTKFGFAEFGLLSTVQIIF